VIETMKLFALLSVSVSGHPGDHDWKSMKNFYPTMFGYDFRGHDFPVSHRFGGEFLYTVMNDNVYQYSVKTGKTYDLGGFESEETNWTETTRHYTKPGKKLEGDDCVEGRTSTVFVSCGSDDFTDETSYVENVVELGPACKYNIYLKLACSKLRDGYDKETIIHQTGCPHTANVLFHEDVFGLSQHDNAPTGQLKMGPKILYHEDNHLWLRDLNFDKEDDGYEIDYGYYHKTTRKFLDEPRLKARFDKYLKKYDDHEEYQITRYYTNGFEDNIGDECSRYTLLHLKCGDKNELLSIDPIDQADNLMNLDVKTCGYVARASLTCERDTSRKDLRPYPKCDAGEKCELTPGDGILSTHCV